jgi:DNA-binding SARP family transcriptional activator
MANPKVLKAVSIALAALAELDPKEQEAALAALQAAMKSDRPRVDHSLSALDR